MRPQEKIFEALRKWVRLRASAAKRANGAAHRDLYIGTIMSQPKDTSRLKHTKKKSPPLATSDDRSKAAPQYVVGLGASAGGLEALERFFKAMRSRNPADLPMSVEDAHQSCVHCQLGNIAYRLGRSLEFNPKTERFTDREANQHISREYRKGFEVPKLAPVA